MLTLVLSAVFVTALAAVKIVHRGVQDWRDHDTDN